MVGRLQVIVDYLGGARLHRDVAQLATLAVDPQMLHAAARMDTADALGAQLGAELAVIKQADGAIVLAPQCIGVGRRQQRARLAVADRRCLPLGVDHPRRFTALDRVTGHGIGLAQVFEQGRQGGQLAPDRGTDQVPVFEAASPGEQVSPG